MMTNERIIETHPEAYVAGKQDRQSGVYRPEGYDLLSFEKKAYTLGYNSADSIATDTDDAKGQVPVMSTTASR